MTDTINTGHASEKAKVTMGKVLEFRRPEPPQTVLETIAAWMELFNREYPPQPVKD